ncbi:MAG: hypothetical protein WAL26_02110 [Mycobacterium sp.]
MIVGFGPAASSSRGATFSLDGAALALDVILVVVVDVEVLPIVILEPQLDNTSPRTATVTTLTMGLDFIVLTPVGRMMNIETDGKRCSAPVQ